MKDDPRIERLIRLAERLIAALENDIALLKQGKAQSLATSDPQIQKLTALYGREATDFDLRIAQAAAPALRQRFVITTTRFRDTLQRHGRILTRVKTTSEGMVQAIAREVERANAPMQAYGPQPGRKRAPSGAMVFNRVV